MTVTDAEPVAVALEKLGLAPAWHENEAGDPFASLDLPLPTGGTVRMSFMRWDDTLVVRAHDLGGPPPGSEHEAIADRLTAAWLLGRVHYSPSSRAWAAGTGVYLLDNAVPPSAIARALGQMGAAVGQWHRVVLDGLSLRGDVVLAEDLRRGLARDTSVTLEDVADAAAAGGVPLEPRLDGKLLVQRLVDDTGDDLLVDVVLWDGSLLVVRGRLPAGTRWPARDVALRRLHAVNDRLSAGAACIGERGEPHVLMPFPLADAKPTPTLVHRLIEHAVDGVRSLRRRVLEEGG